jgi:hypothetical protein
MSDGKSAYGVAEVVRRFAKNQQISCGYAALQAIGM